VVEGLGSQNLEPARGEEPLDGVYCGIWATSTGL
jgi:hypothetical protein